MSLFRVTCRIWTQKKLDLSLMFFFDETEKMPYFILKSFQGPRRIMRTVWLWRCSCSSLSTTTPPASTLPLSKGKWLVTLGNLFTCWASTEMRRYVRLSVDWKISWLKAQLIGAWHRICDNTVWQCFAFPLRLCSNYVAKLLAVAFCGFFVWLKETFIFQMKDLDEEIFHKIQVDGMEVLYHVILQDGQHWFMHCFCLILTSVIQEDAWLSWQPSSLSSWAVKPSGITFRRCCCRKFLVQWKNIK